MLTTEHRIVLRELALYTTFLAGRYHQQRYQRSVNYYSVVCSRDTALSLKLYCLFLMNVPGAVTTTGYLTESGAGKIYPANFFVWSAPG